MQRPYRDADLVTYSAEHLWYELWMFYELVDVLGHQQQASASSAVWSTSSGPLSQSAAPWGVPNTIARPPGASTSLTTVTANLQVEAFMAHLRNLIEFLYSKNPRPTDVVAADFCAAGVWNPTPNKVLDDARTRVNKELAHLTTDRVSGSPARKGWNVNTLAQEFRPVLHGFQAVALPSRLSPRVKNLIR
jgi:hypothetical protein